MKQIVALKYVSQDMTFGQIVQWCEARGGVFDKKMLA